MKSSYFRHGMDEKQKKGNMLEDTKDLALSVLPSISSLLTPETLVDPQKALVGVGSAILASKLAKFYSEFQEQRNRGQIKEDISGEGDEVLEMLSFIKDNEPDDKITAAKKLFFKSIEPGTTEAERMVIFELMQKCKKLTTNDLAVLKAAYQITQRQHDPDILAGIDINQRFRRNWFLIIGRHLGHKLEYLVESSEENLVNEKLITPLEERSPSTYHPAGDFRLTDLGIALCKYLAS
jgi:hypothetical protein